MPGYHELITVLSRRVAGGELASGGALPSVRALAQTEGTTPATVAHAYQALAAAGVIVLEPRRAARVASHGPLAARRLLRGERPFRLAGSDDPALSLLIADAAEAVAPVGARGSFHGLSALWAGTADGAALHLRHAGGDYNAPFARGVLRGREPVLLHLWRREQGLIVAPGNPRGIASVGDLRGLRVARRPPGTGTRTLLDRLLLDAGLAPESVVGPSVELHLDVALTVATGEADAGLGLRGMADTLELAFVPLAWEPFQVVTTQSEVGGLEPLLSRLREPELTRRIRGLGGYDLEGAGSFYRSSCAQCLAV